ncbi:MAG: enoyl-CoA hydratase [Sporomusaceae bacterium]|nr:enoyl-CoA hydratase [Sporomusaceae bacterium]
MTDQALTKEQSQVVRVKTANKIAIITMNRPKAMNALNQDMVNQLLCTLQEVENDPIIRTVILTGEGRAFSAGGDLEYISSITDPIAARNFISEVGEIVTRIMTMKKPVIAMVNGVAAGAGFNLALACDIVFCAESARFAQSFVKVGLIPDCGGLYLLPRIVGMHKAKELMFTADLIHAQKALELNIINKIFADAELESKTVAFAEQLTNGAPIALSMVKSMVNRSGNLDLASVLELESDLQTICMQTEDHKEGVKAFKEKRLPVFHGK